MRFPDVPYAACLLFKAFILTRSARLPAFTALWFRDRLPFQYHYVNRFRQDWRVTGLAEDALSINSITRMGSIAFASSEKGIYASRDDFTTWWVIGESSEAEQIAFQEPLKSKRQLHFLKARHDPVSLFHWTWMQPPWPRFPCATFREGRCHALRNNDIFCRNSPDTIVSKWEICSACRRNLYVCCQGAAELLKHSGYR